MSSERSVTYWIAQLKAGDPVATQKLFERYFEQLCRFARAKLRAASRRVADQEDVALSAFNSFYVAAAEGRFPQLFDRDDLWRILLAITARKAAGHIRHAHRQKRGGGKLRGESFFSDGSASERVGGIGQVIGKEPTPSAAAEMVDEFRRLLDSLGDETLKRVAILKMQGYANKEIADVVGCALRSVERKLHGIREVWSREAERP
jgi:DNA-directed RNA polymerase specialized sigma24 family protein